VADQVYRRLVRKYHPGRHPAHAEFMTDINELWQAATGSPRR
jgi:curved DNA-binding protein CbpA